ncbi:hypothetical protein KGF56_004384 [Candida oxycetoniae]|uniref:SIR4-interacting protein SIF2 n=1 Tax=Candida oxycetoniae TaxID=497107 RepID=A0AAI9SUH4_9ASCO|nr:uncharacterized protein KGF56_004384 [Candida oxycetoniae]KAI3402923.2 hypothetical protein KGF56_004384 [Candida oxycetoniae]
MSLTSKELNYLIWRYFQESGYDLSAYTFDRQSQCSKYEDNLNEQILEKIQPGCLVDLVQKGILYTIVETEALDASEYTFLGSLVRNDLENLQKNNTVAAAAAAAAAAAGAGAGAAGAPAPASRFKLKNEEVKNPETEDFLNNEETPQNDDTFQTMVLSSKLSFASSITCAWHPMAEYPHMEVFAYGKSDGKANISALRNGAIVESVELSHPDILNFKNNINMVSWSPSGNTLITTGAFSEIRAWSPMGKLKNIANTVIDDFGKETETKKTIITTILWSMQGKFVITIASNNQVNVWDGLTLSLVRQIRKETEGEPLISAVCWLAEDKFAISTNTNSIKIYDIRPPQYGGGGGGGGGVSTSTNTHEIFSIGSLAGHDNHISSMKLNSESKLLATCSDFDYEIKVWSSLSSSTCLDLNVKADKKQDVKLHTSPIIELDWIPLSAKNILLSISMDSVLNIWDADTGENIKSSELFKYKKNFSQDQQEHIGKNILTLNASMSPNGKLVALGDDYGKISIWNIDLATYKSQDKHFVKCVAIYVPSVPQEIDQQKSHFGLCDLKWDHDSCKLIASYLGVQSVLIDIPTSSSLDEEQKEGNM